MSEPQPSLPVESNVTHFVNNPDPSDSNLVAWKTIHSSLEAIISHFMISYQWEESIILGMKKIGEATGACRISIYENIILEKDRLFSHRLCAWTSETLWQPPPPELLEAGFEFDDFSLENDELPEWRNALAQGEVVLTEIKNCEGCIKETLSLCNIEAMLVLPMFLENRWWGWIEIDHTTKRFWTENEIEALKSVIKLLSCILIHRQIEDKRRTQQRFLSQLHTLNCRLLESTTLRETQTILDQHFYGLIPADWFFLALWNENTQEITPLVGSMEDHFSLTDLKAGQKSLIEELLANKRPLIIEDTSRTEYVIPPQAVLFSIESMLGMLVYVDAKPLGFALMGYQKRHFFPSIEIEQFENAARQSMLAAMKSKLLEEANQRTAELSTLTLLSTAMREAQSFEEVLTSVLDRLIDLFQAESAAVVMRSTKDDIAVCEAARGSWARWTGHTISGKLHPALSILTSYQVYLNNDIPSTEFNNIPPIIRDLQALAGVPIIAHEQTLGAIWIGCEHLISNNELRLLITIGNMVANTLHRMKLLDNLRQSLRQSQMFSDISSKFLNEAFHLENILQLIVDSAPKILPAAESAVIHLLDPKRKILNSFAASGNLLAFTKSLPQIPVGEGIAGLVVEQHQAIRVPNVQVDARYLKIIPNPAWKSLMVIPLLSNGTCVGTLSVQSHEEDSFREEDEKILSELGVQAAVAITNARLHVDLQKQYDTLQNTQARLVQSEKLAAIGQLVAGVAHELNNPLTSIIFYAQLLQSQNHGVADQNGELNKIISESLRCGRIVRGLLEFSRQHPKEMRTVQINQILQTSIDLLTYEFKNNNIQVETYFAADLPVTQADPFQFQQIFVNLFTNSLQAITKAQHGHLIRVSTQAGPSIYSNVPTEEPWIRIEISDDGPGISKEDLLCIFDPFFTTKAPGEGTGLGLSVVYGIVSEHDGHIWAESQLGLGATFYIEIPVRQFVETQTALPVITPPVTLLSEKPSGRILVIDDEDSVLEVLTKVLKREGYRVEGFTSARKGLARLAEAKFDLILCDIRMPDMNGIEFYRALSQQHPEMSLRIIFTTGDIISPVTRHFLEETQAACLNKPFEREDLIKKVREQLAVLV